MTYDQYFLTYSGIRLPLKMTGPLSADDIDNRNTWFGVKVDEEGRILLIHKRVYGAVELEHEYAYHPDGSLKEARITDHNDDDEDARILSFPAE
tara:strand:- start:33338 stop:33619 length:282 start_codon:yes stop_codon:yes gene_type:complete